MRHMPQATRNPAIHGIWTFLNNIRAGSDLSHDLVKAFVARFGEQIENRPGAARITGFFRQLRSRKRVIVGIVTVEFPIHAGDRAAPWQPVPLAATR